MVKAMKIVLISAAIAISGPALADEALRRDAAGLFGQLVAPSGAPSPTLLDVSSRRSRTRTR